MKNYKVVICFFLIGILVSSIAISPFALDNSLTIRFLFLSLFLAVTFFLIKKRSRNFLINVDVLLLTYFLFTVYSLLSFLWAINISESFFEIGKTILSFCVFVITYYLLKKEFTYFFTGILKISIGITFLVCFIVIWQWININNNTKDYLYMISGINGHKNLVSSFLFLLLSFLTIALLKFNNIWRILVVLAIIFNLFVIALLRTKAVWLGIGVGAFFIGIYYLKIKNITSIFAYRKNYLFLVGLMFCFNLFFFSIFQPLINVSLKEENQEVLKKINFLDQERLTIWSKTYDLSKQHYLIGVGLGNWQINYPKVGLNGLWRCEDLNVTFQRPHNDFLWILSELGIVGLNLYLFFIILIIFFLNKIIGISILKKASNSNALIVLAFIIGFLTISFFDFPKERIEHLIWINLLYAVAYFYIKKENELPSLFKFNWCSWQSNLAILIFLFFFYIGFLRQIGEYYTRKIYLAKNLKLNSEVIKFCSKAESFFYSIDPTSIPITWYSGNSYVLMGDYVNAQKDFIKAYHYNPYNRNVLNDLASCYVISNRLDLAKKYYSQAAIISPRFDESILNLTVLYINEQNYIKAQESLNSLKHNSDRRDVYQKLIDGKIKK